MVNDGRSFNFRKGPSIQHRIRILNPGNKSGESFGITIPTVIAEQFQACWMRIYVSGTSVVMESGCKLSAFDVDKNKVNCFEGMREIKNKQGEMELIK